MKKTFTQKSVCEKRGRNFFLSLFVLVLLLAGITKNAQAQSGSTGDKEELTIYDFTGRKLATYSLDASANSMNISETNLSNGIYFYRIIVNHINIKSDKLIIIK